MANIATTLKAEISRVSRKEIRGQLDPLRKALAGLRAENAALKRRAEALEKQLKHLSKAAVKGAPAAPAAEEREPAQRFSAKGFASQRKRLELSAADCGLLFGASGQSVYNWETGAARPQARHFAALAAFRKLGKKSAATQLETLREAG